MKIIKTKINKSNIRLSIGSTSYLAEFLFPHPSGRRQIYDNKWKLSCYSYHTHRKGNPIQTKNQRPRYKHQDYFNSIEECIEYIKKIHKIKE